MTTDDPISLAQAQRLAANADTILLRATRPADLETPIGAFWAAARELDPSAIGVIRGVGYPRLVLSACHPLYSAAKRIVVFARLVRTVPRGAALHTGRS